MTTGVVEQRNPYKGNPPRPWIRLRFEGSNGFSLELDLLADTGNPFPMIFSQQNMGKLKDGDAPDVTTNFGLLQGGWVNLAMPEFALLQPVMALAAMTWWPRRRQIIKTLRALSVYLFCDCWSMEGTPIRFGFDYHRASHWPINQLGEPETSGSTSGFC